MSLLQEHISFLESQVGNLYIYGGEGQVGTESFIKAHTKGKNETYALAVRKRLIDAGVPQEKILVWDCSGLITENLIKLKVISGDMTANGLKGLCSFINKSEVYPGCLCFRVEDKDKDGSEPTDRAHHVGEVVAIENGSPVVIHAKGHKTGIVREDINASGKSYWEIFGVPSYLKQMGELSQESAPMIKYTPGMKADENVKAYQNSLISLGYSLPKYGADGKFGDETLAAHNRFQNDKGLAVTRFVDTNTLGAILKALVELTVNAAEMEALKTRVAGLEQQVASRGEYIEGVKAAAGKAYI